LYFFAIEEIRLEQFNETLLQRAVTCLPLFSGYASRLLVFVLFLMCACSTPTAANRGVNGGETLKNVFVAHDGWHAAIIVKKVDSTESLLPDTRDFPWAEYLEFSWGDKDYFPAPKAGIRLALRAAFWSGGSVLHVVGFNGAPRHYYPSAEIFEINLSEDGLQQLLKFISDTFSRSQPSKPADARPGLSSNARFYPAERKFSIFRTCNTWVAEALNAGGIPINPRYVITAASLSARLRPIAMRVD
jgi:uncharacterized protein (TIGR02117 family)